MAKVQDRDPSNGHQAVLLAGQKLRVPNQIRQTTDKLENLCDETPGLTDVQVGMLIPTPHGSDGCQDVTFTQQQVVLIAHGDFVSGI